MGTRPFLFPGFRAAVAEQGGVGNKATAGLDILDTDIDLGYLEATLKHFREEIRKTKKDKRI